MSQSQTQSSTDEPTVDTIADPDLWAALADGVNMLSAKQESVFEFDPDGLTIRLKDSANVGLIRQTVDADDFEHFDVTGTFTLGINTGKLSDLVGVADTTVDLSYNWSTYKMDFTSGDVDYELSGIQPDAVAASPTAVPGLKDEHDWVVDVDLPVDVWERATNLMDLAGTGDGQGNFFASKDSVGDFVVEGQGDDDKSRVRIHESDAFNWRVDPPEDTVESRHANAYMKDFVKRVDEDTVRFVTGEHLPMHVWTTRADGRIDTKYMQAPRIPK